MARLLRPHTPLSVRVVVACGQLRTMFRCSVDRNAGEADSAYLPRILTMLSLRLGGGPLQLDHDPALENRTPIKDPVTGEHKEYEPAANDPAYLVYRTKAGHQIKTNVRGDGAQYSDRALAARERRRQKGKKQSRPIKNANRWPPKGSRKFAASRKGSGGEQERPTPAALSPTSAVAGGRAFRPKKAGTKGK